MSTPTIKHKTEILSDCRSTQHTTSNNLNKVILRRRKKEKKEKYSMKITSLENVHWNPCFMKQITIAGLVDNMSIQIYFMRGPHTSRYFFSAIFVASIHVFKSYIRSSSSSVCSFAMQTLTFCFVRFLNICCPDCTSLIPLLRIYIRIVYSSCCSSITCSNANFIYCTCMSRR